MKIYQVVEVVQRYIDGYSGDHEWEDEISKGYFSTKEKAEVKLKSFIDNEYDGEFKIKEIVLDIY